VSISCRENCLILLMDLCFGVRSLQEVSVDFVQQSLIDFAEEPVLRCAISTESECPLRILRFLFWLIFLIISADRSYYTSLFSGALYIILIVSDSLLQSCWPTVCEFAAKANVYSHHGSLISHILHF
jgi:hypothetical protein